MALLVSFAVWLWEGAGDRALEAGELGVLGTDSAVGTADFFCCCLFLSWKSFMSRVSHAHASSRRDCTRQQ